MPCLDHPGHVPDEPSRVTDRVAKQRGGARKGTVLVEGIQSIGPGHRSPRRDSRRAFQSSSSCTQPTVARPDEGDLRGLQPDGRLGVGRIGRQDALRRLPSCARLSLERPSQSARPARRRPGRTPPPGWSALGVLHGVLVWPERHPPGYGDGPREPGVERDPSWRPRCSHARSPGWARGVALQAIGAENREVGARHPADDRPGAPGRREGEADRTSESAIRRQDGRGEADARWLTTPEVCKRSAGSSRGLAGSDGETGIPGGQTRGRREPPKRPRTGRPRRRLGVTVTARHPRGDAPPDHMTSAMNSWAGSSHSSAVSRTSEPEWPTPCGQASIDT